MAIHIKLFMNNIKSRNGYGIQPADGEHQRRRSERVQSRTSHYQGRLAERLQAVINPLAGMQASFFSVSHMSLV